MVYHLWARRENCAQRNSLTGATKYSRVHDASHYCIVGVFNGEGPPVPIPNTEVKLTSADNTCLETDREDRSMPTQKNSTASAVEFFYFQRNAALQRSFEILAFIARSRAPLGRSEGRASRAPEGDFSPHMSLKNRISIDLLRKLCEA